MAEAAAAPAPPASRTFEERLQDSTEIRERYKDRLPVIISKATTRGALTVPNLDKERFLVPQDLTLGQLVYVIRRRLHLPPDLALFLFVNGALPPSAWRESFRAHYPQPCRSPLRPSRPPPTPPHRGGSHAADARA